MKRFRHVAFVLMALLALAAGCASNEVAPPYFWIVHDRDRSDADRVTDQRRKPEKLLEFYGVLPGMRVLDLGAGGGYNTELLARVVGPAGVVYAQNSPYVLQKFVRGRFEERLKKPVMARVVHLVREFDDPVPPDVRNLDLVTFNFVYHDTVWLGADRAKMNRVGQAPARESVPPRQAWRGCQPRRLFCSLAARDIRARLSPGYSVLDIGARQSPRTACAQCSQSSH